VGCGFCISIYWIYIRKRLQSLITLPITSHEPATSSGSSSAPSWRKSRLWIFRDELFVMNSCGELLWRTPNPDSHDELPDVIPRATSFHRLLWWTAMARILFQTLMADSYSELLGRTSFTDCYDRLLFQTCSDELLSPASYELLSPTAMTRLLR
jgi:hypothetical protein